MTTTEAQEQRTLFQWIGMMAGRYPELALCYHIPNGGSRNAIEAHNLRLQGVKAGVPDICLPVARGKYHGLYIELKRQQKSRVSVDQKIWLNALRDQGYLAVVCYGWEDAKNVIEGYLNGKLM